MARINIEDSLFKDHRFTDLCIRLGSRHAALGAFMEACILAQKHYLSVDNDRLIPLNEWARNPILAAVFDVGLAENRGKGIYVSGSDEQFKWLIQRSDAGKKLKHPRTERPLTTVKRKRTKPNGSDPLTLSLPLTPTLFSDSSSGLPPAEAVVPADLALNAEIWKAYSDAYEIRYRTKPVRNAKVNGQIAQFAKRLGSEAPAVARFYVSLAKSYYVTKVHDFGLCLGDAEALRTQWATGRTVTQREANQADDTQAVANQLKRIKAGEL
jgi:hypothetical protein